MRERLRPWLPTGGLTLAVLLAWAWPVLLAPTRLALGSSSTEGPRHLWSLWVVAADPLRCGPLVRCAPGLGWPQGFTAHLMDPINLIFFLPGYWLAGGGTLGAVLGWNLLHLAWLVVGMLGGAALARELELDHPWLMALVAVGFGANAYFLGLPWTGRSEYLPAALWAWHLWALLRFGRGGSWPWGVAAALLLGLTASGGTYVAIFIAILEVPLGLWLLSRWSPRPALDLKRLALVAAGAGLVLAPQVVSLLQHPPEHLQMVLSGAQPAFQEIDDLRSAFVRSGTPRVRGYVDQPAYAGMALLGLGLWGARVRPRQALPWLGLGLLGVILGLGEVLPVGSAQARLPAAWLTTAIPQLQGIQHWGRLSCVFALPLSLAAAWGARHLAEAVGERWRSALLVLLALGALVDQATWPRPWTWARPTFEAQAPADLLAIMGELPPGPVLELPLPGGGPGSSPFEVGFYEMWQLQHQRPVTATPGQITDVALGSSVLAAYVHNRQLAAVAEEVLPGAGPLSEAEVACARVDAHALAQQGLVAVVLHRDLGGAVEAEEVLVEVLGQPHLVQGELVAWRLGEGPPPQGQRCPRPDLAFRDLEATEGLGG